MLSDVVGLLACPHCGTGLAQADGHAALRCAHGHSFDIARQGYVSLLAGDAGTGTADTPEMVAARAGFLGSGHFAPLAGRLALLAAPPAAARILDAGAGTGYYLAAALDHAVGPPDPRLAAVPVGIRFGVDSSEAGSASALADPAAGERRAGGWPAGLAADAAAPVAGDTAVGLALDLSKYALRRAAKVRPRVGAAVCDLWRPLPVGSGTFDLVLNVFAPRNGPEYRRVLAPGGVLAVVTPTSRHLHELVGPLGLVSVDARKRDRVAESLGDHFRVDHEETHESTLDLDRTEIGTLVGMGPSARHIPPAELATRIAALPERVAVTASFRLCLFHPVGVASGK